MFVALNVGPVPMSGSALWSSTAAALLIGTGIVLVLCALPPVRAAVAEMMDRLVAMTLGRKAVVVTAAPAAVAAAAPVRADLARREIDEFDLSFFEK